MLKYKKISLFFMNILYKYSLQILIFKRTISIKKNKFLCNLIIYIRKTITKINFNKKTINKVKNELCIKD